MKLHIDSLQASSFFEAIKNSLDSPQFLIFCGLAAVILVAIIVFIVLLSLRFKLTLHLGSGKIFKKSYPGHRIVELHEPDRRDGFVFGGWYEDENFTRKVEKVFRMPMRGASLYAKWIPIEELREQKVNTEEPKEAASDIDEAAVIDSARGESEKSDEVEVLQEVSLETSKAPEVFKDVSPAKENIAEEESVGDEPEDDESGEGDEIEGAVVTTVTGNKVFVQYRRSFSARLIQADDEMKDFYNQLRNELLSCVGVKERVSWNYDSYNVGRRQFAKVNANTKSLILYLALTPAEVDEKYNFRDVSEKKRYANVPVRFKITGSRSFKYACELLDQAAEKFELDFKRVDDTKVIPYETREELIKKKLIKVYAKRETGETVTEEQLDEMIAEGATVEKLSAYTVTDKVSVSEADTAISDATAQQIIALAESREERAAAGRRAVINLDTISANYREGEYVNLQTLKERGLVDKKATACKVLARGVLDKSLTIEAVDFSLPAVKMIAMTGGKVVKLRRSEKV